ncbi:MAG: ASCH domain-containing protein [Anaerolineae bacterium]|jgi:hypothetical protein|nr:ASCH domain-containing protein [Anaerolineae bacterium]MBT7990402.1 ASCH domain-containing protein [Anaerolineae bacterium]
MKALNVDQPWAELIIQGIKTIELRKKRTSHRGILAIRATKTVLKARCHNFNLDPDVLAQGAIIGTVELVGLIEMTLENFHILRDQHLSGMLVPGTWKWGWQLENPKYLLEPIPCSALPGMFTPPEEISEQVSEAKS